MPAALNYFRLINKSRSPVRDNRNGAFWELTGINRRARAARLREKVQSTVLTASRFALIYNVQLQWEDTLKSRENLFRTYKQKKTREFATRKLIRRTSKYREVLLTVTKLLNCNLLKIKGSYGEIS